MEAFGLSEKQAQAIVEMTLGRLSGMERQKIEDRLAYLNARVDELSGILADPEKVKAIVREELTEIRDKFASPRRTVIVEAEDDIDLEDLIERHACVLTLTGGGYIKRLPADTYTAQHRGGKGVIGMTTKEEDYVEQMLVVNSHSHVLFFTNTGKVQMRKAYQVPEASRTAKGTNVVNLLDGIVEGERVTAMIEVDDWSDEDYLVMVTKKGILKRTLLSEYAYQRKGGKIALTLDEGDELVFVKRTNGDAELIIATREGNAVRFAEEEARAMGRTARGVIGIRVYGDDYVCGVAVVEEGKKLVTITSRGFGKLTEFDDFRLMKNRGGKGVTAHKLGEKTGYLTGVATVDESDDLMMITDAGTIIRTPVLGIPTYSRTAGGVIVMRLADDASLVNFTKVAKEEELEIDDADSDAPAKTAEVTEAVTEEAKVEE